MAITVDATLSTTSTNPVENKAITNALNTKADTSSLPHGVPSGGTTGQVLVKSSNSDYAVEWQTITTPSGTKNISITSNGTTTEDVTNYATASITTNVPASAVDSGTKNISITQNGTTTENVVGYASASISVSVSGGDPNENMDKFLNGTLTTYNTDVTSVHSDSFRNASVQTLVFTALGTTSTQRMFANTSALKTIDISGTITNLPQNTFNGSTAVDTIIFRKNSVITISATNAFTNTPFAQGKTGGTIYIPKTLYDALGTGTNDYKASTNWATMDSYGTITWAKIEGSQYENYYADGTPIT